MKSANLRLLAASAVLAVWAPLASAATLDIDITGIESYGFQGDAGNAGLIFDLGAGATITGISWDVGLTPVSPSWSEEATISLYSEGGETVLNIFDGGNSDPVTAVGGMALGQTAADGLLLIEFYEVDFDDIADGADAIWDGTLSIEYETAVVPVPAAAWLLGSGLLGLLGLRRRA